MVVRRTKRDVVVIERKIQIAPTFEELYNCIEELCGIYGKEEVLLKTGLHTLRVEGIRHRDYLIKKNKETFYKGIEIIFDEDQDKRIFTAIDIIERDYPSLFEHTFKAGEHEGALTLWVDTDMKIDSQKGIGVEGDWWSMEAKFEI